MNEAEINRLIVDAWNFAHGGDDNPALPHIEQLTAVINEVRIERDEARAEIDALFDHIGVAIGQQEQP